MDSELDDRAGDMRSIYELLARAYEHLKSSFYVPVETGPAAGFTAGGYMMAAYCDEAQGGHPVVGGLRLVPGGVFPLRACRCGGTTKTRARNAGRGCSTVFSVATKP